MASWIGLALLILLSANAVLCEDYVDPVIDANDYLRNCIISSGSQEKGGTGAKEFHTGSQCYARTVIKFKVEAGGGRSFLMQNRQDSGLVAPAVIKYKFGECDDIVIVISKENGEVKYNLRNPDDGSLISLDGGFDFHLERRPKDEFKKPDTMEVRTNNNPVFSKQCNAFEKDPQDAKVPTLLLFEQKILSGVPDLTLVWNVWLDSDGYFGAAHATEIIIVNTTTSTTTTTVKPPPAPVAKPSIKPSTRIPVPSTSSLPTTVGASVKKVQEKSESAADKIYFEQDAKSTDPKAVSKEAASKEAASKEATSKEIASK